MQDVHLSSRTSRERVVAVRSAAILRAGDQALALADSRIVRRPQRGVPAMKVAWLSLLFVFGCAAQAPMELNKSSQPLNRTGQAQTAEDLRKWLTNVSPDAQMEVYVRGQGWLRLSAGDLRAVVEQKPSATTSTPRRNWP